MTTAQRAALWIASIVAGVSGLAYAAMKYLLPRTDPFSAYGHPLQPHALRLHLLAVPVLLFVVGWLYGAHAQNQLRTGDRRGRAGGRAILALTFVLALSGTLVQVFADADWRPAAAWVHGVTGTAFVAALAAHARAGRRGREAGRAGMPAPPPRRPLLRALTFPRPEPGAPAPAHPSVLDPAAGCAGCPGCGSALGTVISNAPSPPAGRSLSRDNRD